VLRLVRTGSNARSRGSVHNLIECSVCWGKDARYATVVHPLGVLCCSDGSYPTCRFFVTVLMMLVANFNTDNMTVTAAAFSEAMTNQVHPFIPYIDDDDCLNLCGFSMNLPRESGSNRCRSWNCILLLPLRDYCYRLDPANAR
jgi:hypothetical protein